jgi:hypothetical protein
MRIPAVLVSTLVLALLSGCRPAPSPDPTPAPSLQICTKIGCSDGLNVLVENAPATPYTVEAVLPDGTSRTAQCEAAPGCEGGVFLADITAAEVTVRITAGGGTSSQVVRPEYVETQPNGPNCPPTCRQARVQVRYSP